MRMSYRPKFHISPPQGRLNDPNGLTLVGDELHVFYQHDPLFPSGPKRTGWGHAATGLGGRVGDGVWRHYPDALYPGLPYDQNGCYSGCAVVADGVMRLFYTGNVKRDGQRFTSQNIVDVHDLTGPMGGQYRRYRDNPVIDGFPEGYTAHFRDPHITRVGGRWRMVIGAQRVDKTGAAVLYTSDDLETWRFESEIEFAGLRQTVASAYMWECPNLVRMTDQSTGEELDVLVICPQFPDSDECGYIVGRLDGLRFDVVRDFTPLDYGHEFYAPQLIEFGTGALMLGWMGLPGRDETPTLDAEGWVHQLTLPRQLVLSDAVLHTFLHLPADPTAMVVYSCELGAEPWTAELVDVEGAVGATVTWNPEPTGAGRESGAHELRGTIALNVDGLLRWAECRAGEFVFTADGAAVEMTAGGGEVAFSSCVFAADGNDWAQLRVI